MIGLCSRVLQESSAEDVIRRIEAESEPLEVWLGRQANGSSAHESERTFATDEPEGRASPTATAESPVRPGCGHCGDDGVSLAAPMVDALTSRAAGIES